VAASLKKVAIIGCTGLPAKYGGFETLADYLTRYLEGKYEITVYCSDKYFAAKGFRREKYNGARLVYLPFNANGYQSIIYDIVSIIHALFYADALLILGISGTIVLPVIKLFSTRPVIINIDGKEWKRPKWNALTRRFLRFSEKLAVKYADTVISDNPAISAYVKEQYGRETSIIEYGGDHARSRMIHPELLQQYSFLKGSYAFTVCRIEPENNIHVILDAYSRMPDKTLAIVGLWNHGTFGTKLKARYAHYPNIHLLDPVYDVSQLDVLRSNAGIYIHGHSAGGTNPSLVEAMCLGLPVIAHDVSYNRETTRNAATYFSNSDDLIQKASAATAESLKANGECMRSIASERYTWKRIAAAYDEEIHNLVHVPADLLSGQVSIRTSHTMSAFLDSIYGVE
jgi:glycosyltransferase involved in cell wall biosynthesis